MATRLSVVFRFPQLIAQFSARGMSRLVRHSTTEVVKLSYWVFAVWWVLILVVHVLTGVYNALYAYTYWVLKDTYLNYYLESFKIGVPPPNHRTVAIVHATMCALHAVCILLMVGGSLWQCTYAFTPWSSSNTDSKVHQMSAARTSSLVMQSFTKVYTTISDRRGICGVNGVHFHALLILREILETALQTVQAYRMSELLPRVLLNRFYVVMLVANCWSSVVVYSSFFTGDEALRRFVCIVLDCIVDLIACMGVELMILLSYKSDYVVEIRGFWDFTWHNDEWAARALNEFRMLVVVSWSDLASRAIFSLGLVMTTTNMKELLERQPRSTNPVLQTVVESFTAVNPIVSKLSAHNVLPDRKQTFLVKIHDSYHDTKLRTRSGKLLLRATHLLFGAWGIAVLGLHIHASVQPQLPQCLMQVRPWAASRPSCYLVGLDCHTLAISGKMDEVATMWNEFDSSTVVQLLIRHCPAVEIPDSISEFHGLHGVKMYNSTLVDWSESAALTQTNHPEVAWLYIVRVNMTHGLLPAGLQSIDFPPTLFDMEFCVTNLREIPDDLDIKWPMGGLVIFEYGQLTTFPLVLTRLGPSQLSVSGNPIQELPPALFHIAGMAKLGIGATKVRELPRNVPNVSPELSFIYIGETEISFFWSWVDELLSVLWVAPGTPYCAVLVDLESGAVASFNVSVSPEYSPILMDPSVENRPNIMNAVYCYDADRTFYPIMVDDYYLAISTPPVLMKP